MTLLPKILPRNQEQRRADLYRRILRREAKIGGELFGKIPKGRQREFFCVDTHTWIWYESWTDQQGSHDVMTRYQVRPNGILKSQNGQGYQYISKDELRNLAQAVYLYHEKVTADLDFLRQSA